MPTSEARIAANRANARKSTGPKTPEGKARSRENARKHGLTGEGVAVFDEDAAAIAERFAVLQEELAPRCLMATVLVKRVAMLSVRLDRCYRQEANALSARCAGASASMIDARKAEVENLVQNLQLEPVTNARRLLATPEGVDALIEQWERLKTDLDNPRGTDWSYQHAHHANYLNGSLSGYLNPTAYMAWTNAMKGDFKHVDPAAFPAEMADADRRQSALEKLGELVDADLARIQAIRAGMDTLGPDADLARAPQIALFDPSPEAILARKYEAATERALYKALQELRQIQAEQEVEQEGDEVEPAPVPAPLASFEPTTYAEFATEPEAPSRRSRRPIADPKEARKRSRKSR